MVQIVGKKHPLFEFKNESGDQIWSVDISEDKIVFVGEFDRAAEDLFRAFWSRAMDAEKAISESDTLRRERDELARRNDELAARLAEIERAEPIGYLSPVQLDLIRDGDGEAGRYMPVRKTPRGLFTLPIYAAATVQTDIAAPERAEPAELLRAVLNTEIARGTLHKLRDGQGTDTLGGRSWLAAFAWAGESPERAGGCGACGDSCRSRGSCRLADESPKPAAELRRGLEEMGVRLIERELNDPARKMPRIPCAPAAAPERADLVAAERERCAQLCDRRAFTMDETRRHEAQTLAALIRGEYGDCWDTSTRVYVDASEGDSVGVISTRSVMADGTPSPWTYCPVIVDHEGALVILPGAQLEAAADAIRQMAGDKDKRCTALFNGRRLVAGPGDSIEKIVGDYLAGKDAEVQAGEGGAA